LLRRNRSAAAPHDAAGKSRCDTDDSTLEPRTGRHVRARHPETIEPDRPPSPAMPPRAIDPSKSGRVFIQQAIGQIEKTRRPTVEVRGHRLPLRYNADRPSRSACGDQCGTSQFRCFPTIRYLPVVGVFRNDQRRNNAYVMGARGCHGEYRRRVRGSGFGFGFGIRVSEEGLAARLWGEERVTSAWGLTASMPSQYPIVCYRNIYYSESKSRRRLIRGYSKSACANSRPPIDENLCCAWPMPCRCRSNPAA